MSPDSLSSVWQAAGPAGWTVGDRDSQLPFRFVPMTLVIQHIVVIAMMVFFTHPYSSSGEPVKRQLWLQAHSVGLAGGEGRLAGSGSVCWGARD